MAIENFSKIEKKLLVLGKISPDKGWKREGKALLLSEFAQPRKEPNNSWRFAFAVLVLIVLSVGITSVAVSNSLPGEIFYPVKRSYEQARLAFGGKEAQLVVHKKLVDKRVDELVKVVEQNNTESTLAIAEVENSVSEINKTVVHQKTRLESIQQHGQDSPEIKESLASLVPSIEHKQSQLAQIETSLLQDNQEKVSSIIDQLEDLKLTITTTIEPQVKDIEKLLETPKNQPQP